MNLFLNQQSRKFVFKILPIKCVRQPYTESLVFPEVFIQFSRKEKEKTFLAQFCNDEAFAFFFIRAPLKKQISRKFAISIKEDYF